MFILFTASTQVELTVQQRPLFINSSNPNLTLPSLPLPTMNSPTLSSVSSCSSITPSRPLHHHHSAPARDRITGPQPVDVCNFYKTCFVVDINLLLIIMFLWWCGEAQCHPQTTFK